MNPPVVHLHLHTHYSLLRGAMGIEEALAQCKAMGMSALAITDTNGLYGAVPFYLKAREMGVKPIIGAEIEWNGASAVCLARSREGYRNLCRLITARHLQEDFDLVQSLVRHQEGLTVLSATPAVIEALARDLPKGCLYVELQIFFGRASSVFVGTQRAMPLQGTAEGGCATRFFLIPKAVHAKLAERGRAGDLRLLAKRLGLPLVATNDVHYIKNRDSHHFSPGINANTARQNGGAKNGDCPYFLHCVLSAVRENVLLSELFPSQIAHPEAYLKSPDEMVDLFHYVPEALENTRRIADECAFEWEMGRPIFPRPDLPPGETAASRLRALALRGAAERYRPLRPEARARLDYELEVIERLGFSGYFIIVWGIVEEARRRGIPIVGRGSAADSLVAYCLGITRADPLHYNLYFERFLNPARTDPPDIDLDMCWRRRDEVLDYVYRRYGAERVAMVSNHNLYQARSAFRDVARVFGLPLAEIDDLSAALPHDSVANIRELIRLYPEWRRFPIAEEPYSTIISIAERMDGFPRHLGIHVGGMVIGERPLTDYVPLERATKGIVITQFDMGPIEEVGLVKMDLLGNRALSAVHDAAEAVRRRGVALDLDAIPDGDPAAAEMARRGRTLGCFQIESPGMRNLLQMMRARTRDDLIVALSLIRPGPSASGMKERYLRRRLGLEKTVHYHPDLAPVLAETYGILLYQEHILKVAEVISGFSLAEGDQLRKAITKERSPERIEALRDRFLAGARRRGIASKTAEEIWKNVVHFAGFSFNKAHAVTYGQLAYQALYLKTHYPAEFMAAVMSNRSGFYEPRVHLEEARRMGVRILPPDVNDSEYRHKAVENKDGGAVEKARPHSQARRDASLSLSMTRFTGTVILSRSPERSEGAAKNLAFSTAPSHHFPSSGNVREREKNDNCPHFVGRNAAIRLGFMQVRELAGSTVDAILKARAQRPFASLDDFLRRVRISKPEAENLILCGAFDSLGPSRPAMLWELYLNKDRSARSGPFEPDQPSLFAPTRLEGAPAPSSAKTATAEYAKDERLRHELEILGMTVSDHPMALLEDRVRPFNPIPCAEVARRVGRLVTVAGIVDAQRRTATSDNKPMYFLTLEDATGMVEVVLFPPVYQRFGHVLSQGGVFVVKGRVESQLGAVTLSAAWLKAL